LQYFRTSYLKQHSLIITAMGRKGENMLKRVLFVTCILLIASITFLKNNATSGFAVNAVPKPKAVSVTHGRKEIPGIRKRNYSMGQLDLGQQSTRPGYRRTVGVAEVNDAIFLNHDVARINEFAAVNDVINVKNDVAKLIDDVDEKSNASGCRQRTLKLSKTPLPITGLVSFPGSGNTWVRHLIQQMTGIG